MQDFKELSRVMERIIHKYNQVEKLKRPYGTDMMLTRAEIHTVVAVGDYPEINITSLAKLQGITKGAASQMIYKLVDKGLVKKQVSPNSDTEVCLTLTELGNKAYENHNDYHKTADEYFFKVMRDIPDDVGNLIVKLLYDFDASMDERLKK